MAGRRKNRDLWVALAFSLGIHIALGMFVWMTWEWETIPTPEIPVEIAWSEKQNRAVEEKPTTTPLRQTTAEAGLSSAVTGTKAPQLQTPAKPEAVPAVPKPPIDPAQPESSPGLQMQEGSLEESGKALLPPKLREKPALIMPADAVGTGLSGDVLLTVEILENGRVGKILVSRSSGSAVIDVAAREYVSRWLFEPARRPQGGKPVRVLSSVWVRYAKERG